MANSIRSRFKRGSGILLHITSLPGKFGIGNLGKCAYDFIDYLKDGGQRYWQILPIGPVSSGYAYSPYSSYSSFAGNDLFIDPVSLQAEPWMKTDIVSNLEERENVTFVDFQRIESEIQDILELAYKNFLLNGSVSEKDDFKTFCSENTDWLDDYSLFKALADRFGSYNWRTWNEDIRKREIKSVNRYTLLLEEKISSIKFTQFIFDRQWHRIKHFCSKKNIRLIGDIPIYAGMDSADVWANPGIFQFSDDLSPLGVSGVPPDYFSAAGQKWGTPLYRWFGKNGKSINTYQWWTNRMKRLLSLVDIVRIDHFRAFESYWKIDPDSTDGRGGMWEEGPGIDFFEFLKERMGDIPVIAEDLGIITEEVNNLRERTGFPGMKILQFAFDQQPGNPYLPENIADPNCVFYTGTHDNNTSNGWFLNEVTDSESRIYIKSYLKMDNDQDFIWKFITCIISSRADISIIPLQDLLGLGAEFRMNTPGTDSGSNWKWKAVNTSLDKKQMLRLKDLCEAYQRMP